MENFANQRLKLPTSFEEVQTSGFIFFLPVTQCLDILCNCVLRQIEIFKFFCINGSKLQFRGANSVDMPNNLHKVGD